MEARIAMEPNKWQVRKMAEVGWDERFVRETTELTDLIKGTLLSEQEKVAATDAIGNLLTDGLIPTFYKLREIRESLGKDLPLIDQFQMYEDFARKLWKSYKDLTQRAATATGFDIGFVWQKESKFEEGLQRFRANNPNVSPSFEGYFRELRKRWQEELMKFRNEFLEHQQGQRQDFAKFYDPRFAEALFETVPRVIAEILVMLVNLRMCIRAARLFFTMTRYTVAAGRIAFVSMLQDLIRLVPSNFSLFLLLFREQATSPAEKFRRFFRKPCSLISSSLQ